MGIIHVVIFEFKQTASQDEVQDACKRMLALKNDCLHPTTNKPYVKSSIGGRNNSPEGHARGLTHAFVSEFENEEDRKYYLEKDPAHLSFVESLGPVVQNVCVVDFTPGVF
ncbi:hypothetical protein W97_03807 [Coniosporium apollinis CBS 100218]|uniref:Stress-response A/B barrel domain-containing protein n=1 Tax=Coniosporium apollinis (strain CBS 100218) TaxID=1168221 RepID=R7YRX9_CONA1|nr:uncharacterized protein W97_03807 [Coniosporium apollinis CBS 100218]EON64574.1 hypothetical protein W97_03807 [Coniosporium apollinis CBS 100218]